MRREEFQRNKRKLAWNELTNSERERESQLEHLRIYKIERQYEYNKTEFKFKSQKEIVNQEIIEIHEEEYNPPRLIRGWLTKFLLNWNDRDIEEKHDFTTKLTSLNFIPLLKGYTKIQYPIFRKHEK